MARSTKTITIKLFDGTLFGFIKANIEHVWTGLVFSGPRNDENFTKLGDIKKSGAYFLIEERKGKPKVYIGQATNVSKRLKQHMKDKDKEFWKRTCIVICPDINTDDLRYLERSLIETAKSSRQVHLVNKIKQNAKKLENSNMDEFIKPIHLIMPILGFDFYREKSSKQGSRSKPLSPPVISGDPKPQANATFELHYKNKNIKAEGQYIDGEFTVLRNSEISRKYSTGNYRMLHEKTIADKQKVRFASPEDLKGVFIQNVTFASPTAAANVVRGGSSPGPKVWKVKGTNKTLDEWRKEQLKSKL